MSNITNSFFYFFSATPQVLAAITGLFGVVVIFQIQKIRKQLIGIAQNISKILKEGVKDKVSDDRTNDEIIEDLESGINAEELVLITFSLNNINKDINKQIDFLISIYRTFKDNLKKTINKSIIATSISLLTIILSLLILPLSDVILSNPILLNLSFYIISSLVIFCCVFYFLLFRICIDLLELYFPIKRNFSKNRATPMADVIIDGKVYK